jgi:phage terminase large subunit-like protein
MGTKHWQNTSGGGRFCAGTGGTVTGHHGHFLLSDDILKEQLSRKGAIQIVSRNMAEAEDFFFKSLSSRGAPPGPTRILNGQRLHAKDPFTRAYSDGFRKIVFPLHFDPERADPRDHRTEPGEIFCPKLRPVEYWNELIIKLGPTAARAQLEQNPGDPEDKLLRREYFAERWTDLPPQLKETMRVKRVGPGQLWITAWDLTFKEKTLSSKSWVVGQVWCAFESRFYLVDQVRDHMGFRQSVEAIKDLARRYPWITKHLLEDAANAAACQDELKAKVTGIILEPVGGGTFARTQAVEGVWATGAVITPADAPWMGGSTGFLEEHVDFDGTGTTDQVSASSLALVHFNSGNKGQKFIDSMAALGQSPTFRRMVAGF